MQKQIEKIKPQKRIVVVIPVYNSKRYLIQTVESILNQSYQKIDIVMVDDGSTDGSSLLCDELANQHANIKVFHQNNGGVAKARNLALEYICAGNSDYIAFLDADDIWKNEWIDKQIIELMNQNFDLIGLQSCFCNHSATRRSEVIPLQEGEYKGGVSSIWIHAKQHIGAMLYRVDFIKQYDLRFYSIKTSEDKIFSMQCLYLAKRIYLINKLMHFYRQNLNSLVHTRGRGISYFLPIIDAYIQSDIEMSQYRNSIRGCLYEGEVLAKSYIMDMIEEELESYSGEERLKNFFENRQDYLLVVEKTTSNKQVNDRWTYIKEHKKRIIIKKRVYSLLFNSIRKVYYIQPIKFIIDLKRYPIKM